MGKKLDITPAIKAAIIRSTGDAQFNFDNVSVFETISLNTLPVNKRGLFNKAVTNEATLREMASYVNAGSEQSVPMHTMHDQGYAMPIGRVVQAEVVQNTNGLPELRSLFYIGNEHPIVVAGIDNGSIDEVSVGFLPAHINCSQCGFDYLGPDATSDNVYGAVCANDHEIGVDGTHVIMNGLGRWLEQSVVPLGAAKNAKILSRTKSLMGAAAYETLAASGAAPEATVLFTRSTLTPPTEKKPEPQMDMTQLITLNASLSGEKAVALHEVTTLKASVESLTASKTALEAEVTTLKAAAAAPADVVKLQADLVAAQAEITTRTAFARKEADRLAVAAGVEKLPETATFTELTASIEANRDKLTATFNGGNSQGQNAGSNADQEQAKKQKNAFKMAR